MTNNYSKMRASAAADNRSKSVDFSELLQPQHSDPRPRPPWAVTEKIGWNRDTLAECCDDEINGERFGVVLGIRRSVSSPTNSAKGLRLERKQKVGSSSAEGKYSAVKRVFSMRRSASVSERYCRIHDQTVTPTAYFEGEDSMDEETASPMKPAKQQQQQQQQQHKGGKIIKACKRFFSLN